MLETSGIRKISYIEEEKVNRREMEKKTSYFEEINENPKRWRS